MIERPTLTDRLNTVYKLAIKWRDIIAANGERRLIDVGSDHGYVSLEGIASGDYDFVIATDIHENPAKKTESILNSYGYKDKSRVVCTDGLKGVDLVTGDTVIMAGLGGNNMMDIITSCMAVTSDDVLKTVVFCLQPQKTIEELRVFLCSNGFEIKDETVIAEREKYYPLLTAVYDGQVRKLDLYEKYFGPVLSKRKEEFPEYFAKLNDVYTLKARGDEEISTLMNTLSRKGDISDD